jgi:hypothetical protein
MSAPAPEARLIEARGKASVFGCLNPGVAEAAAVLRLGRP